MPKKIKIRIPVLVGSNGKWYANGYDALKSPSEDADWGFMSDNLDSSPVGARESIWPAAEARFIVEAEVEIPDETPTSVIATSVAVVASRPFLKGQRMTETEKSGWQPIETAPTHRLIDLWVVERVARTLTQTKGRRYTDCRRTLNEPWRQGSDLVEVDFTGRSKVATHWMPIPSPPSTDDFSVATESDAVSMNHHTD